MPRWKTTNNIFIDSGEFFEENWLDYDKVQYPKTIPWDNKRTMSIEDVDIWEVITEMSHGTGVFAAWLPYAEYYIVVQNFSLVAEFYGENANRNLEEFLIINKIYYPRRNVENYSIKDLQDLNFFSN